MICDVVSIFVGAGSLMTMHREKLLDKSGKKYYSCQQDLSLREELSENMGKLIQRQHKVLWLLEVL